MPRGLKTACGLVWLLAVAWPWTGLPWRAFSVPAGALAAVCGLIAAASGSWRKAAESAAESMDSWDGHSLARLLAALFFVWLASLKLCQYASFQSHYGDLGQDANICWNTLHGRPFFDSVMGTNFLGDHFEPVLALCALAFKLWPSAAVLLIIQSAALALAVVPLLALSRLHCKHSALGFALAVLFVLSPFLHLVSEFDFHPEALFIPAALWALLFWERGRPWAAGLVALLCLGIKEDIPLALAGFGLYLALCKRRKTGWGLLAACGAAFAIITLWAIPHFAGSRISVHNDRYASLGVTTGAMIQNVAWHPWIIPLRLLRPRVLLTILLLLGSVGGLPLAAPSALIPLLGACLHHLLSDYRPQYSLVSQYSAQTVPLLFYAALKGLGVCEERLWRQRGRLAGVFLALCGAALAFQPYYSGGFRWRNVREAARLVRQVPNQVSLATDGAHGFGNEDLLVHLALRTQIVRIDMAQPYRQPAAEYVLIHPGRSAAYAAFLSGAGDFARLDYGDGLELWHRLEDHR